MKTTYTIELFSSRVWKGILTGRIKQYYFRIRHRNGNIICHSQGYSRNIDRTATATNLQESFMPGECDIKDLG